MTSFSITDEKDKHLLVSVPYCGLEILTFIIFAIFLLKKKLFCLIDRRAFVGVTFLV